MGRSQPDQFSKNLLFFLSQDSGLDFTDAELIGGERYTRYVVPIIISRIIRDKCVFYDRVSDTVAGLSQEGVTAVRHIFKKPNFSCVDLVETNELSEEAL